MPMNIEFSSFSLSLFQSINILSTRASAARDDKVLRIRWQSEVSEVFLRTTMLRARQTHERIRPRKGQKTHRLIDTIENDTDASQWEIDRWRLTSRHLFQLWRKRHWKLRTYTQGWNVEESKQQQSNYLTFHVLPTRNLIEESICLMQFTKTSNWAGEETGKERFKYLKMCFLSLIPRRFIIDREFDPTIILRRDRLEERRNSSNLLATEHAVRLLTLKTLVKYWQCSLFAWRCSFSWVNSSSNWCS